MYTFAKEMNPLELLRASGGFLCSPCPEYAGNRTVIDGRTGEPAKRVTTGQPAGERGKDQPRGRR